MSTRRRAGAVIVATLLAGTVWAAPASAVTVGDTEGCTPGFWKNHTSQWEEHEPTDPLAGVFAHAALYGSTADADLIGALRFRGGAGTEGAARILLRAATASLLNAAHDDIEFPIRRFQDPGKLVIEVNKALASRDRSRMLELAEKLDAANNLGCPL